MALCFLNCNCFVVQQLQLLCCGFVLFCLVTYVYFRKSNVFFMEFWTMFACYLLLLLLYNALDIYTLNYVRNMWLVCCGFVLFKLQLLCCSAIAIALLWLCAVLCYFVWWHIYILENQMCSLWNFYGTHNNIYIYIYIFIKFLLYTQ